MLVTGVLARFPQDCAKGLGLVAAWSILGWWREGGFGFRGLGAEGRGTGPALAGKLGEGGAFALRARGRLDRFQCSLRPGPAGAVDSRAGGQPRNRENPKTELFTPSMGGPTVQRIIVAGEGLGMDRLGVGEGDGW